MTGKKVTLTLPTSYTSKTGECEMFITLATEIADAGHSYLASLMSTELAEWFFAQVNNDLDCNLAQMYTSLVEKHRALEVKFEKSLQTLSKVESASMDRYERMTEAANLADQMREALVVEREHADGSLHNQRVVIEGLQETVVNQYSEITALKAKLYDLMSHL